MSAKFVSTKDGYVNVDHVITVARRGNSSFAILSNGDRAELASERELLLFRRKIISAPRNWTMIYYSGYLDDDGEPMSPGRLPVLAISVHFNGDRHVTDYLSPAGWLEEICSGDQHGFIVSPGGLCFGNGGSIYENEASAIEYAEECIRRRGRAKKEGSLKLAPQDAS